MAMEMLDNDLAGSSELLRWDHANGATEGRDKKSSLGSEECQPVGKVRAGL